MKKDIIKNDNVIKTLQELGIEDKDQLLKLTDAQLKQLALKVRSLTIKSFKDYIPQWYQKKFHESPAHVRMFIGGNRSGKTIAHFHDLIWSLTNDYPEWYPEELRLYGPVYARWIATDFKEGIGGVFQPYFDEFVPKNYIKRAIKTQQGILSKIYFENGSVLELMTDEQDIELFEGWHGHRLCIDEPCARARYIASTRGLIDYNGKVSMSLTPLSEPWIYDELYDKADEKEIFQITVNSHDNKHIPETELNRFESKLTEEEKEARIHGRFKHLTGVIYKEFDRKVHVVSKIDVKPHWSIVHVVDPHDRKPHAHIWAAVDEFDNLHVFEELEAHGTVSEVADQIKSKEWNFRTRLRIMDPNKSKAPAKVGAKGSLVSEFAKHKLYFYTNINDKIDTGHAMVHKYLYYNKKKPIGLGNRPRLYIGANCEKTIKGMTHYMWDDFRDKDGRSLKETPKDLYKDFPDLIRYLCMAQPRYSKPEANIKLTKKNKHTGY
jgi:hypothetical protein